MAVKIVVLDDGDTWADSASVYTLTDEAYEKVCNGEKLRHIDDAEILQIDDLEVRES